MTQNVPNLGILWFIQLAQKTSEVVFNVLLITSIQDLLIYRMAIPNNRRDFLPQFSIPWQVNLNLKYTQYSVRSFTEIIFSMILEVDLCDEKSITVSYPEFFGHIGTYNIYFELERNWMTPTMVGDRDRKYFRI